MSIYSSSYHKKLFTDPNTSLHKICMLFDPNSSTILDVGCSSGYLGEHLKNTFSNVKSIDGIEIDKRDRAKARLKLDHVYNIDIQNQKAVEKLNKSYDTIIFADVLEHTSNPNTIISQFTNKLSPDGQIIISIPNVIHQSVLLQLISKQWNYEQSGILDRTHLRFFDYNEAVRLVESNGLYINKIDYTIFDLPIRKIDDILSQQGLTKKRELIKLFKRPEHKIFQFIISCTLSKPENYQSFSNIEQHLKPVSDWISEWDGIWKEYSTIKSRIEEAENQPSPLQFQLLKYQENYQKQKNTIDDLQRQLKEKTEETNQYYTTLNEIYHSRLWKLLGLYKNTKKITHQLAKRVIPLNLRKKLSAAIQATTSSTSQQSIISPKITQAWKEWSYYHKDDSSIDIINFSVIAWDFRFQRPQQIAKQLGLKNHRVFYIKNEFLPYRGKVESFAPIKVEEKSKNVYEVTLSASKNLFIYHDVPTARDIQIIKASIKTLINQAQISFPIAKIDHPFWSYLIDSLHMPFIYDCMDNHQGFDDNSKSLARLEKDLFAKSSLTLVSSQFLNKLATKHKSTRILTLPNAGDFEHFSQAAESKLEIPSDIAHIPHPIVGYYGAIAEWFDTDILQDMASHHSDKSFVLIGNVTNNTVTSLSKKYSNIFLLGEKSYSELPKYLQQFDICTIPFILSDLIKATHPVKLFEYFAAQKPVIATKMPEILEYKDVMYLVDKAGFSSTINSALKFGKTKRIRKIAQDNTWTKRTDKFVNSIHHTFFPKVSIVLLSYNHADMVKNTIDSIMTRTFYPNYELIIVDNNSDTKTVKVLNSFRHFEHINLIFNPENYGFSKGNNIGMAKATGDYIILLNNDVLVTPGWISRLLNHYHDDIGLVGPVTNSIGNEAKIDIDYNPFEVKNLESEAFQYTSTHWGETLELKNIAAFCWIMSRQVYKKIGKLDERFGRGMFEDDDYCRRVRKNGYRILCADDTFIHHFGGTSFKLIESKEYRQLFDQNRKKFENKWHTKWIPHQYRH